jgi:hypothetical protein
VNQNMLTADTATRIFTVLKHPEKDHLTQVRFIDLFISQIIRFSVFVESFYFSLLWRRRRNFRCCRSRQAYL